MTTLTAYYDLAVGPVSYDFVVFLIKAEMQRRKIGATRMHVCIVPMSSGMGGMFRPKPQYDEHEARWRLMNIVIPACSLFNATFTLAADWLQAKRLASAKDWKQWPEDWDRQSLKDRRHLIGDVITWCNEGAKVPRIKPSQHAMRKVGELFARVKLPVVTMTMRKTYLPERNSDPKQWFEAREFIERRGYAVTVIDDTSSALHRGRGFAELNLDLRAAMYEQAAFNIQANNGTASLCWFGSKPYAMLGAGIPAYEWEGLFVKQGLRIGESWPWASEHQRIVYRQPTRDVIIEEFEKWATATS